MYRHQDHSAGADQHFTLSANSDSSPFNQAQFATPMYDIDPNLHGSPQHLHPRARNRRQSPHVRQSSPGSMQPPSSTTSPRVASVTPNALGFMPNDRKLPDGEVSADTIVDAFVDFIIYCNPNFPLDVDTGMLKTAFQNPPKSDNKDFDIYRLYELIKKFEAKEIKTWGQLALDLGVEPPDASRNQSVQKVQQYTVRLKRWMRAMHIDAFFDYLNGKQHSYFNDLPHPSDPYPPNGRDGVIAEEDLAIRALEPSFRPKRGRRRNSETEQEDAESESAAKQPRLLENATPFSAGSMSAVPMSAHPDGFNDPWAIASAVTPHTFAPWARPQGPTSGMTSSNLRWQLGQTPNTPHPMSAMSTSMAAHIDAAFDVEPKSAVTPSTRRKKRHGPAVSSAWPSNGVPGAKPRGRPPANRTVQDGPFTTFPADPNNYKARSSVLPTPISTTVESAPSIEDQSPCNTSSTHPQSEGRGHRLSLQVPVHTGGPVRLATPPTLLVNGETNDASSKSDSDDVAPQAAMTSMTSAPSIPETVPPPALPPNTRAQASRPPGFSYEALKRILSNDLLRATLIGTRRPRLTGDEAKRLADAMLDRLAVPRTSTTARDDLARLTAASWLGVSTQFNVPLIPPTSSTMTHTKRINITRFRIDEEGYEEITFEDEDESGTPENVREILDVSWTVTQGGCTGSFEMKALSLGPKTEVESMHDNLLRRGYDAAQSITKDGWLEQGMSEAARLTAKTAGSADDNIDWKARCRAMEFAAKLAKGEGERRHQHLIEKVLDAVMW